MLQPARSIGSATRQRHWRRAADKSFNPRAPCGARLLDIVLPPMSLSLFNPRAPCGARRWQRGCILFMMIFNPRAPCGARLSDYYVSVFQSDFSIHALHAERDKSRSIFTLGGFLFSIHALHAERDYSSRTL